MLAKSHCREPALPSVATTSRAGHREDRRMNGAGVNLDSRHFSSEDVLSVLARKYRASHAPIPFLYSTIVPKVSSLPKFGGDWQKSIQYSMRCSHKKVPESFPRQSHGRPLLHRFELKARKGQAGAIETDTQGHRAGPAQSPLRADKPGATRASL